MFHQKQVKNTMDIVIMVAPAVSPFDTQLTDLPSIDELVHISVLGRTPNVPHYKVICHEDSLVADLIMVHI